MASHSVSIPLHTVFGKLKVIDLEPRRQGSHLCLQCLCVCGRIVWVRKSRLRDGQQQCRKCGSHLSHGHTRGNSMTPIYRRWADMVKRCTNPKHIVFRYYGGRGIRVCDRWIVFANFLADMGDLPTPKHELDRYPDKNGNYEPGNCRWATRSENMRNTRVNHLVTFQGKTQCLAAWSEETGLSYGVLKDRLDKLGWTPAKALTTPSHTKLRPR